MPRKRSSQEPPVMTLGKALPVIVIAFIFDALRFMFEWFVISGPALAAVYCTVKASGVVQMVTFGLLGTKTAGLICSAAAIAAGTAVAGATAAFGAVMAMAVGFAGFLTLVLLLMITNARIFKVNKSGLLWLVAGLGVAEIPFIGSFPAFSVILWRLYRRQIKVEKAAHERWEKENADAQLQERNQQALQIMQIQAAQQARFMEQEAANEEQYAEEATQQAKEEEEFSVEAQFEQQGAANDDTYSSVSKAA